MEEQTPQISFSPMINGFQKMALYETKARFYLISSNNNQTKFRVLKIDRTEPRQLLITDDKVEYSQREIKQLLSMIDEGNKCQSGMRQQSGLKKKISSFGIVGFIRFLEGYYMILITKRRKAAIIGHHIIYKIEDTTTIYIPHESVSVPNSNEQKYLRLFQNVDLSSNFYFSYSYDLTRTLQYNMTSPTNIIDPAANITARAENVTDSAINLTDLAGTTSDTNVSMPENTSNNESNAKYFNHEDIEEGKCFGVQNSPQEKFMWNNYLLRVMIPMVHSTWVLPIMHGFIDQGNICVYGKSIFVSLIARRSSKYAGTRFLKRGANFEGDCANEVETEQIVYDSQVSSLSLGRFTSFVQLRGSIPCHWSQDISKMVPKPPISLDVPDPYAETAGKHFNKLLHQYGSPIIALNLVKRREKRAHESILFEEYDRIINHLNTTIPPRFHIHHIAFDMARINKQKEESVMSNLSEIAVKSLKKTGYFQSSPPYYSHHLNPDRHYVQIERSSTQGDDHFATSKAEPSLMTKGRRQTGIVRVNCVDCLDRTNTAQFTLGKCALGFQLYSLGVLEKPFLDYDTDTARMLEDMYEDHGDTLALQYGGSQLVHRIKTYRHTAPWSSQGNDIMQSLSRYYSNTFSDTEKQQAMNIFLGIYIPKEHKQHIWDLQSDYLLHQSLARGVRPCHMRSTSQWWDDDVIKGLPLPINEWNKESKIQIIKSRDPAVDFFKEFYRPHEYAIMSEVFTHQINHSVRDYMPQFTSEESPFTVRLRPGKKDELGDKKKLGPPSSSSGQCSTASSASSENSSSDTEGYHSDLSEDSRSDIESEKSKKYSAKFEDFFPTFEQAYNTSLQKPSKLDLRLYKKYAQIHHHISNPKETEGSNSKPINIKFIRKSVFTTDSTMDTTIPSVPRNSREIYGSYVNTGKRGPLPPPHHDLLVYQKYANFHRIKSYA